MPEQHAATPPVPKLNRRWLLMFAAVIAVMIVAALWLYVHRELQSIKEQAGRTLEASSEMKARQLGDWYEDELHDATLIAHNKAFLAAFHSWHANPIPAAQVVLSQALHEISLEHDYSDLYLFDITADASISVSNGHLFLDSILKVMIREAMRENNPTSVGLYYCPQHGKAHMDIATPFAGQLPNHAHALVFRFEPEEFLYPVLAEGSFASVPLRTMLLDMLVDSVLVISGSGGEEAELLHPRTLSGNEGGVIRLASKGRRGLVEYADTNGVEHIGWISEVPNGHWIIISEMEKSSLYADLYEETAMLSGLAIAMFVAFVFGLGFLYTHRQRDTYRELLRFHQEFRSILYAIGDAVISTNRDGTILHMNPEAERLTGVKEQDVVGTALRQVYNLELEEGGDEVGCAVERALKHTGTRDLKSGVLLRTPTGERIPILESVGAYSSSDGHPAGVVIVFRDQTAQREKQRIVEESESKYRALFDATTDGIILLENVEAGDASHAQSLPEVDARRAAMTNEFRVCDANDMLVSMFASREPDLFARLQPSVNDQPLHELCRMVLRDAAARGGEFTDHETGRHYLVTVYSPGVSMVAVLLHDFTRHRENEAALHEKMRDLERFNNLTIDRELRMIELKHEVNALLRELGRDPRYTG